MHLGIVQNLKSVSIHPSTKIGGAPFAQCDNLDEDSRQQIHNCFINSNNLTLRHTFKEGDGPTLGFKGATQKGYGPEMWGITLQQMKAIMKHPLIYRDTLMRDVVRLAIKPVTKGLGFGYALLANQDAPLKAKIMMSVSVSTFAINCVLILLWHSLTLSIIIYSFFYFLLFDYSMPGMSQTANSLHAWRIMEKTACSRCVLSPFIKVMVMVTSQLLVNNLEMIQSMVRLRPCSGALNQWWLLLLGNVIFMVDYGMFY